MKLILALSLLLLMPVTYAKKLIIGAAAAEPPMSMLIEGKGGFSGFEIDMMQEICKRIQADCTFRTLIPSDLILDLDSKKIDLGIAAIIIPAPGTYLGLSFSIPYLPSSTQFITTKDSKINSLDDIKNKVVGVRLGSLFGKTMFGDFVLSLFDGKVKVNFYLSMDDVWGALKDKRIDVAFSNTQPVEFWYVNNPGQFKLIGKPIPIGNGYGIAGRADEQELMIEINKAILAIEEDGTYEKIYSRYFTLQD